MKLLAPFVGNYVTTQKFAGNANPYYAGVGLKGHPGLDLHKAFDASILASHDSYVYKILNNNNPDTSKYRAVCTIIESNGQLYELIYGHLNNIYVRVGDSLRSGDLLASMGNTGEVYSQGLPVTDTQRSKGAGAHLHYQLRPVVLSAESRASRNYLLAQDGSMYQRNGMYYHVPDFENGFNGCVDPEPYLYKPSIAEQVFTIIPRVLSKLRLIAESRQ